MSPSIGCSLRDCAVDADNAGASLSVILLEVCDGKLAAIVDAVELLRTNLVGVWVVDLPCTQLQLQTVLLEVGEFGGVLAAALAAGVSTQRVFRSPVVRHTHALEGLFADHPCVRRTYDRRFKFDLVFDAGSALGVGLTSYAVLHDRVFATLSGFSFGGQIRKLVKLGRLLLDHGQSDLLVASVATL